ncbi:MAG: 30S ribosomal protein S27ae [Candidatus Aenigmarchaeota archaeon]|nr:30S ribosomal protein S27ae [Candidatus Aenigmarchaeota archaeon]
MKHKPVKQSSFFKLREGKIERTRRYCPRCGDGYVLAEHKDRWFCGHCLYTEWKKTR